MDYLTSLLLILLSFFCLFFLYSIRALKEVNKHLNSQIFLDAIENFNQPSCPELKEVGFINFLERKGIIKDSEITKEAVAKINPPPTQSADYPLF